jgi:hypothetical protein
VLHQVPIAAAAAGIAAAAPGVSAMLVNTSKAQLTRRCGSSTSFYLCCPGLGLRLAP